MAITVDPGSESGSENNGVDISQLFRVLIKEVQGMRQAQDDTKDLLSKHFQMQETFTTDKDTQSEARGIRQAVDRTKPTWDNPTPGSPGTVPGNNGPQIQDARIQADKGYQKPLADPLVGYKGTKDHRTAPSSPQNNAPAKPTRQDDSGKSSPGNNTPSPQLTEPTSYPKALKKSFGSVVPESFPTNRQQMTGTMQQFGLDIMSQAGQSIRGSLFGDWANRDQVQRARQKGQYRPPPTEAVTPPLSQQPEVPKPERDSDNPTEKKQKSDHFKIQPTNTSDVQNPAPEQSSGGLFSGGLNRVKEQVKSAYQRVVGNTRPSMQMTAAPDQPNEGSEGETLAAAAKQAADHNQDQTRNSAPNTRPSSQLSEPPEKSSGANSAAHQQAADHDRDRRQRVIGDTRPSSQMTEAPEEPNNGSENTTLGAAAKQSADHDKAQPTNGGSVGNDHEGNVGPTNGGIGGYGHYGGASGGNGGGGGGGIGPTNGGNEGGGDSSRSSIGQGMSAYGAYGRFGRGTSSMGGGSFGGGGMGGGGEASYGENSGIGGWAKKNIPGVKMIMGAADEVKSQRNKNAYYQGIEGGSNLGGVSERAHEEAYVASTSSFGGAFSPAEAKEAFQGVTRIGYNGKEGSDFSTQGGRQDALNYAYHGKTSYGADVSESLRQLEVASKDATINLKSLSESMKTVSDTAGNAGVNAKMARQNLMDLMQTGMANGMNGSAAQNTASNIATGQAAMGKDFEDYSYAGQMSSQNQYIMAAQSGQSRGQLIQQQETNPVGYAKVAAGSKLEAAQSLGNLVPAVQQAIQQQGGGKAIDEPTARQIAQSVLGQNPDWNNPDYWTGYIAMTGADPSGNPMLWLTDLVMTIAGQNTQLQAAKASNAGQPTTLPNSGSTGGAGGSSGGGTSVPGSGSTGKPSATLPSGVSSSAQGYMNSKTYKTWQSDAKSQGSGSAAGALQSEETSNGRSRVIEGILQQDPHADHSNVEIETKTGQRVMSLADAIKDYPAELESGSAKFMSGPDQGKTVSDLLGQGNIDASGGTASKALSEEAGSTGSKSGQSLSAWQKKHPATNNTQPGTGSNGTVILDLTAAAQQLLQVSSATGNVQTGTAAGTGAPVQNNYSDNATRGANYGN